jgi:hypothetical protein
VRVIDAVGEYSCAGTGLTVKLKLMSTPADTVDISLRPDGEDEAAVMLKVAAPRESVVALVVAAVRPVGSVIVTTAAAIGDELPSYRVITTGADPPCGTVVAPARAIFGVCETVTLLSADEDPAEAVIVPVPDNAANDALTSVAVHVPAPDVMHTGAS